MQMFLSAKKKEIVWRVANNQFSPSRIDVYVHTTFERFGDGKCIAEKVMHFWEGEGHHFASLSMGVRQFLIIKDNLFIFFLLLLGASFSVPHHIIQNSQVEK